MEDESIRQNHLGTRETIPLLLKDFPEFKHQGLAYLRYNPFDKVKNNWQQNHSVLEVHVFKFDIRETFKI